MSNTITKIYTLFCISNVKQATVALQYFHQRQKLTREQKETNNKLDRIITVMYVKGHKQIRIKSEPQPMKQSHHIIIKSN